MTQCNKACASTEAKSRGPNISIIITSCDAGLSAIELIRPDTTLDLSQGQRELKKEEKEEEALGAGPPSYSHPKGGRFVPLFTNEANNDRLA